jgi:hypothetical protein
MISGSAALSAAWDLADEGADAPAAVAIDFGAGNDLARRLLG